VACVAAMSVTVTAFTPPAHASTITTAHSTQWYDTHACRAFHTWLRHPTAKHLARFGKYAAEADPFVRIDGGAVYRAVRHGAPRVVVKTAAGYFEMDCATLNGYGL
jgi:hypothetical protein